MKNEISVTNPFTGEIIYFDAVTEELICIEPAEERREA